MNGRVTHSGWDDTSRGMAWFDTVYASVYIYVCMYVCADVESEDDLSLLPDGDHRDLLYGFERLGRDLDQDLLPLGE